MNFFKKLFGQKSEKPDKPALSSSPLRITEITPAELQARLDNGQSPVVVDMRAGWEYQAGHIPGALHMFVQDIPARFHELSRNRMIVFQCWHGNASLQACGLLLQNGWDPAQVVSLRGGMAGWVQTHGPGALEKS